ncbi:MAG TPA: AMP-binding protein [Kofleriaceae bacterium]|jgi:malonyl-CoA/methylmalonyl-CoA synthetase|nr:AMP-binding protein [Kofleriaceae bacterium]
MDSLFPWLTAPSERLAVRVGDRTLSQRELAQACAHHVQGLAARGVAPGARVGVWTQPALETVVALVAHAAAGYVSVPIDPKLGETELAHVLRDAAPRLCVAADADAVAGRAGALVTLRVELATGGDPALAPRPIRGEPALVLYTSGTTGAPKGALITDRNIAANLDMLARAWAWADGDVVVHALPLFHVHGLVLGLFGSQRRGGALRWVPRFAPAELAAALGEHPGALLFAVPTMYHRLCEAAENEPSIVPALRAARVLVSGSAPLSTREHGHLERLTGHRVIERYGLTETLINCSTRHDGDRRAGFVGPPLDGVELRLVDDERRALPDGDPAAIGEICVRGPHVFAGYLNNPDATRAVLDAEGWFYTGDLATRAEDGQLRIVGRRSTDLIKCGGFKVGAGEVEGALLEHPAVAEAAVIGAPDDDLGERIVAFLVTRGAVEPRELEDHVAARLSPHKRPREVHVVDALPRNAMGKVQKTRLASSRRR